MAFTRPLAAMPCGRCFGFMPKTRSTSFTCTRLSSHGRVGNLTGATARSRQPSRPCTAHGSVNAKDSSWHDGGVSRQRLRTERPRHPPHGQGLRALRTSRAREEHLCVAISAFSRQEFIDAYRPPKDWSCEVIHWGIDTEMFHPVRSEPRKSSRSVQPSGA
ncbi:MAG: hypothetical protein CM15mP128_2610 [Methanobacteriota archaeon]|nr:MAG: hypothetical protein CM15mP128_2610 [Euryarchaeota archaeon]